MNAALAWLRTDPDWTKFALFLLFFLVPLGARLVKSLLQKAGLVEADPVDGAPDGRQESALERRRRTRAELARKEAEGGELWRRLARGEESARPRPTVVPAKKEDDEEEDDEEEEDELPSRAPLVTLDEQLPPLIETTPAAAIDPASAAPLSVVSGAIAPEAAVGRRRPILRLGPDDLRRAVVLTEVFAPPLALREP